MVTIHLSGMVREISILLISLIIALSSCTKSKNHSSIIGGEGVDNSNCVNTERAYIVDFTGLDGCSYIIKLERDGTQLEPINMGDYSEMKINNKHVVVSYHEVEGRTSACMVGKLVNIDCMKAIQ